MTPIVTLVPVLEDNYSYILQSGDAVAIVDPGDANPIINKLNEMGITPTHILNTHHHGDHIQGNKALREKYNCVLIGPLHETKRIADMDITYGDQDFFNLGDDKVLVIETPGHTTGHICFYLPDSHILFSGDLLFALGCGRAFEGTAQDLFHSIAKIKDLPKQTRIYCGHEYTAANAVFALTVEPDNKALIARSEEIKKLHAAGTPTIPTTLEYEWQTNPFIRAKTADHFSKIRHLKDNS